MRIPGLAVVGVLFAALSAAADGDGSTTQSATVVAQPTAPPSFRPFSSFGSDIPGYQNPAVGGAPAGKADAHPFHPFTDFGVTPAQTPAQRRAGELKAPPVVMPAVAPPVSPEAREKEEDEEGAAAAAEAAAEAAPVDEFGKPVDVELEDAQANFHTVVEAFIAKNSVDGCWPFKEAERTLCLNYLSTDTKRLKKDGKGAYKGLVVLRDAKKKVDRAMEFKIDFSGDEWSVLWVKVLGAKTAMFRRKTEPAAASTTAAPAAPPAFRPGAAQ